MTPAVGGDSSCPNTLISYEEHPFVFPHKCHGAYQVRMSYIDENPFSKPRSSNHYIFEKAGCCNMIPKFIKLPAIVLNRTPGERLDLISATLCELQ